MSTPASSSTPPTAVQPSKISVTGPALARPASATTAGSRTPRSHPQHQISPQFQPRTSRSRVASIGGPTHGAAQHAAAAKAAAGASPRTSRKTPPQSTRPSADSPRSPAGPPRRKSGVRMPGSVDMFKRRHRRTLSDTPTSPFWSPSFEFLPSEDPEVELEDEKFVASVKVDEIAPPTEDEKRKSEILRSISFPASLKAQHVHSRGSSYGGSVPVSPTVTGGPPGVGPKSASPIRRRQSLKSPLNKGRVPCSPRTQALNRRSPGGVMQKRGSAVGAGLHRKHSVGSPNAKSPPLLSPTTGGAAGKTGYVPVSTQRAQRARRALPRRATTDLTPNRLPNAS